MYDNYQATLWGAYGFKDAFNRTAGWWATDYLGIDQGPIILMIENYLTGAVWARMMQDPDVQSGLALAGFDPATSAQVPQFTGGRAQLELMQNSPNPFRGSTVVRYRLAAPGAVDLVLYDALGRAVRTLARGSRSAGLHEVDVSAMGLPSGVYFYRLESEGLLAEKKCVLVR
jgi:hypothetical protein